uniref:Uncharacterized protein n=1 Tax=Triticum urartu TaxID=4572 RepID=A0A8R7R2C1_TRIUA
PPPRPSGRPCRLRRRASTTGLRRSPTRVPAQPPRTPRWLGWSSPAHWCASRGVGSGRFRRGGRRTSLSPRTCGSSGPRTSPRSPPTRSSACSVPSAPTTSSSNSAGA